MGKEARKDKVLAPAGMVNQQTKDGIQAFQLVV
jgi:hypothetical protein